MQFLTVSLGLANAHMLVEGFKGLKPLKPFAYPYPYPSKPLPSLRGKGFDGRGKGTKNIPKGYLCHRPSSAPEVTGSCVMTWVRVGVNRAQVLYDTSSFYKFPLLSIEFQTIIHSIPVASISASVQFQSLPHCIIV